MHSCTAAVLTSALTPRSSPIKQTNSPDHWDCPPDHPPSLPSPCAQLRRALLHHHGGVCRLFPSSPCQRWPSVCPCEAMRLTRPPPPRAGPGRQPCACRRVPTPASSQPSTSSSSSSSPSFPSSVHPPPLGPAHPDVRALSLLPSPLARSPSTVPPHGRSSFSSSDPPPMLHTRSTLPQYRRIKAGMSLF